MNEDKAIFVGKSAKYTYKLFKQRFIVVTENGEDITDKEALLNIWNELDKFVRKQLTPEKHKYGTYGKVLLTDAQLDKLYADIGPERTNRIINYIDELMQLNGNKYKWKDHNLVVRRCHRENWLKEEPEPERQSSYDIEEMEDRSTALPVYVKKGQA